MNIILYMNIISIWTLFHIIISIYEHYISHMNIISIYEYYFTDEH